MRDIGLLSTLVVIKFKSSFRFILNTQVKVRTKVLPSEGQRADHDDVQVLDGYVQVFHHGCQQRRDDPVDPARLLLVGCCRPVRDSDCLGSRRLRAAPQLRTWGRERRPVTARVAFWTLAWAASASVVALAGSSALLWAALWLYWKLAM